MNPLRAVRFFLMMVVSSALAGFNAQAQTSDCIGVEDLSPWLNAITSNFVDGGASGNEIDGYSLCSSAPGPADALDSYRMLVQSAGGDFTFEVALTAVTAGGAGGLVATLSGLDLVSAPRLLLWVETDIGDATSGWLRASLRGDEDGVTELAPADVAVQLPLRLRITRSGGILSAGYVDGGGANVDHLVVDVGGQALGGALRVGMAQFSGDDSETRFASFQRATFDSPAAPGLDCVIGDALLGNGELAFTGKNLDAVTSISVFGQPGAIKFQDAGRLVIEPNVMAIGGVAYGQVELRSAASRAPISVEVAAIGTPFVRGDLDMDGDVDETDLVSMKSWVQGGEEPLCPGAGDVNGDRATDAADAEHLEAWIHGSGAPPAAPFPAAGYVAGAYTCATPPAPGISAVRLPRGPVLDPDQFFFDGFEDARAGDEIELIGTNLPPADELVVWFGDVRTRTLGGDETSLRVAVDDVPSDGRRCLRVIHAQSQPFGDDLRIGGGWLAQDDSEKFCHYFAASQTGPPRFGSRVARDGTIEIPIPRADWQPGQEYRIDASVFMPWLDGVSRGSRALQTYFLAPSSGATAGDDYEIGLAGLAAAMTAALNGGYTPSTPCDCEVEVTPSPGDEKLILAPCLPPPPKPEPAVDGPDTLQKPKPILVAGVGIQANNPPPVECDGEFVSHKDDARRAAWCHFRDVVETVDEGTYDPPFEPYLGHPLFASWKPLQMIVDTTYGGMDEPWILDPDDQPLSMKAVLFDYDAATQLRAMGYRDPHIWALRAKHCGGFEGDWMPKISFGQRVAKTFFVAEPMLPAGMDVAGLYGYVPPGMDETHYLVGLHLAISTLHDFGLPSGYFWWASYWVPAPPGETQTKSGADLKWTYSPTCTIGNGVDRPLDLPAPWNRFIMCTDADPDEGACGNPYAFGECPLDGGQTSCTNCHAATSRLASPYFLEVGWLPSIAHALSANELQLVYDYVEAHPGEFTWWTEPRINPDNPASAPVACLKADPGIWNPFDPNDVFENGEGEP